MKTKGTAALLTFFLGGIGVHRFYLGETGLGLLYLFFCWTFIPSFIALIDFFAFLFMSKEKFDKRYNEKKAQGVQWQKWKCTKCGQSFTGMADACKNCGQPMSYPASAYENIKYTCNQCYKHFFGRKSECPHCNAKINYEKGQIEAKQVSSYSQTVEDESVLSGGNIVTGLLGIIFVICYAYAVYDLFLYDFLFK